MNEDGSTVIETATPTDQSVNLNVSDNVTTTTTDDSVANVATNVEVSNETNLTETPNVTQTQPTVEPQTPTVQPTPTVQDILPNNATLDQAIMASVVNENRFQNIANRNGQAMDNFLNTEYDYDRNEAGTYWVAGAINDNNTQMSFLNTIINEEMYDTLDLQKYYYDTQLGVARAYAAQKNFESAYGFYRAAQQKAIAEGQLTGWYMPAEGRYLLNQYEIADDVLNNPNATAEEKFKAQNVRNTAEKWFAANKITTRGIKCLSMLEYEETVRHNDVMGRLKEQYNKIQMSAAGASGASAYWQGKLFDFKVMGGELEWGMDLNGDSIVGYTDEMRKYINKGNGLGSENWLRSYTNLEDELTNGFNVDKEKLFGFWGESLRSLIGDDKYKAFHTEYQQETGAKMNQEEYNSQGYVGKPAETKNTVSGKLAEQLGDEKLAGQHLFTRWDDDGLHVWVGKDADNLGEEITTKLSPELLENTINDKSTIKYSDVFYGLATENFQYDFQNKNENIGSEHIGSYSWPTETNNEINAFLGEHPDAKIVSYVSNDGENEAVMIQIGEGDKAKWYEVDLDSYGNIEKSESNRELGFNNGMNEVTDKSKINVADFSKVQPGENLLKTSGYFTTLEDGTYKAAFRQHSYLKTMYNDTASLKTTTTDGKTGYMYKQLSDGSYVQVKSLTDSNGLMVYLDDDFNVIDPNEIKVFEKPLNAYTIKINKDGTIKADFRGNEVKQVDVPKGEDGTYSYLENDVYIPEGLKNSKGTQYHKYLTQNGDTPLTGDVPTSITSERNNMTKSTEVLDNNETSNETDKTEDTTKNNNSNKDVVISGGGGGGSSASGDSNLQSPQWNRTAATTKDRSNKKSEEEEPEVINNIYKSNLKYQFEYEDDSKQKIYNA